jgi:hypothetical protein
MLNEILGDIAHEECGALTPEFRIEALVCLNVIAGQMHSECTLNLIN